MKILFVHSSDFGYYIFLGISDLSAYLKQEGHETLLYDTTNKDITSIRTEVHEVINEYKPDLIAMSCTSMDYSKAIRIAKYIKSTYDIKIIFVGVHPTVDPHGTISNECVDMVCVGEGEFAVAELLIALENEEDCSNISNIWTKKEGVIKSNPVRPLIQNLDELPFSDRELFDKQHVIVKNRDIHVIPVSAGRGCPYECPYCINYYLKELYSGKGKMVRIKSVNRLIDEIKHIVKSYTIPEDSQIAFMDEIFTLNKTWLREFCDVYRREIELPFTCVTRIDSINYETAKMLKDAGCKTVFMSIESGNHNLRVNVLNRNHTDTEIINAFKIAKGAGLHTISLNMIGIPYETKYTMQDTINLNKRAKPDETGVSIFQPFQGTAFRDLCIKEGFYDGAEISGISKKGLNLPNISTYTLERTHALFSLYVRYPSILYPIINMQYRFGMRRK